MTVTAFDVISPVDETIVETVCFPGRAELNARVERAHSSVRYWTPFGGFKQSGLDRELGPDAVEAFTGPKNVFISTEE